MNQKSENRRYLFLSIHPQYAELILDGQKTVELRKRRPKIEKGDVIVLYATRPICSVVGTAEVKDVIEDLPNVIWGNHGKRAKISEEEFNVYFESANTAVAILLKNHTRLDEPVSLFRLKALLNNFVPPQSYRYLSQSDALLISEE